MLLHLLLLAAAAARATPQDGLEMNKLIASYSAIPDPFHLMSFYSLPRTLLAAERDGWSRVDQGVDQAVDQVLDQDVDQGLDRGVDQAVDQGGPLAAQQLSTWCRKGDYRVCLLFDAAGVVGGMQVSVSVRDWEQSNKSLRYPIALESQWRRQSILGTEVYSASALFVSASVISEGGRANFTEADDTIEGLFLENGHGFWAMPSSAGGAADVAFTKQGCVKGMGRHFFYNMSPRMACDEHRPFFLLFDDVTGRLHGFGVTLFGRTSHSWRRWWFEAPRRSVVKAMAPAPDAPQCFLDWAQESGLISLHVYFRPTPWKAQCSKNN